MQNLKGPGSDKANDHYPPGSESYSAPRSRKPAGPSSAKGGNSTHSIDAVPSVEEQNQAFKKLKIPKKRTSTVPSIGFRLSTPGPKRTQRFRDAAFPTQDRETTKPLYSCWKKLPPRDRSSKYKYAFRKDGQPNAEYKKKFQKIDEELEEYLVKGSVCAINGPNSSRRPENGTMSRDVNSQVSTSASSSLGNMINQEPSAKARPPSSWKGKGKLSAMGLDELPLSELSARLRNVEERSDRQLQRIHTLEKEVERQRHTIDAMDERMDSKLNEKLDPLFQAAQALKQAIGSSNTTSKPLNGASSSPQRTRLGLRRSQGIRKSKFAH
ncbi:hypothetical protein GTA08_BOTSDO02904 [Botryosphaeria dothidea]|uniref:Uncharacterized protein n=1 Tax=Botryosphaeria dothidea TaxID=55169 RepID=A0A8H4N3L9_9PEZI|nr:hypothetical protein GTA08_BOTSDO02904 [Botryosphaeria dothidea]